MRKKTVLLVCCLGLILVAALVYVALARKRPPASCVAAKTSVLRPIPTARVESVRQRQLRHFPGTVRANRRVELAFSVSGVLRRLNAQEGRTVRKGEVLGMLDQRDFRHERDAAKAKCVKAKRELDRFDKLIKQRVVTMSDYEQMQTDYDVALATLRIREKALADTVLYAPFDGVVVKRHVELYEHVQKEQKIISFQDISRIEVGIQIPERLIAQDGARGLQLLQVRFDADPNRNRWFNASVREYGMESDSVTRTYEVVVALPPPPDLRIFSGMTATVRTQIRRPAASVPACAAVRVPEQALCSDSSGAPYVWVVAPEGGAPRKKKVVVSALSGTGAILCNGPQPGQLVAVAGLRSLSESQPVRPMRAGKEGLDG